MVSRRPQVRRLPALRLRHGYRTLRGLDVRPAAPPRDDSVSADALQDLPVEARPDPVAFRNMGFARPAGPDLGDHLGGDPHQPARLSAVHRRVPAFCSRGRRPARAGARFWRPPGRRLACLARLDHQLPVHLLHLLQRPVLGRAVGPLGAFGGALRDVPAVGGPARPLRAPRRAADADGRSRRGGRFRRRRRHLLGGFRQAPRPEGGASLRSSCSSVPSARPSAASQSRSGEPGSIRSPRPRCP